MEPVRPKVSRNPGSDPCPDQEEPGGVETRQTEHSQTQARGRGGTQVGEVEATPLLISTSWQSTLPLISTQRQATFIFISRSLQHMCLQVH